MTNNRFSYWYGEITKTGEQKDEKVEIGYMIRYVFLIRKKDRLRSDYLSNNRLTILQILKISEISYVINN